MSIDEAKAAITAAQKVLDALKKEQADALKTAQQATLEAAASASRESSGLPPAPAPVPAAAASSAKGKDTPTAKDTRSPAGIMQEINSLLLESKNAQAQLAAARELCAVKVAESRSAVAAVDAVVKQKDKLAKQLSASTETITEQLKEVQEGGGSLEVLASDAAASPAQEVPVSQKAKVSVAVPPLAPVASSVNRVPKTVTLTIGAQSVVAAGGHLDVSFELIGGQWHADDAIHLCAVAVAALGLASPSHTTNTNENSLASLYLPVEVDNLNAFESFEYTEPPVMSGSSTNPVLTGTVKVTLPAWACHVQVSYARTTTTVVGIAEAATVKRSQDILAKSKFISVTAAVHRAPPTGRQRDRGIPRRRGAGSLPVNASDTPGAISMLLELQKNINTFALSASISRDLRNSAILTRAMAWGVPSSFALADARDAAGVGEGTKVYVEIDVCHYASSYFTGTGTNTEKSSACAESVQTFMLATQLPFPTSQLEWSRSQVEIDNSGRLSVRIPHLPARISLTSSGAAEKGLPTSADAGRSSTAVSVSIDDNEGVECLFCGNVFTETANVKEARLLPSGMFDNIMHEFVCSEDISALTLTTSDMATPVGQLLVGPVHITVNPADVRAGSLAVSCKDAPTLIDLFSGQGSALASAPITPNGPGGAVVNIDTCVLHCSRCMMYVGDGQLASDNDCACLVHDPDAANTEQNSQSAVQDQVLGMSDLVDVRLARSSVAVPSRLLQPAPLALTSKVLAPGLASEQSLARTLVHLQGSLGVSAFIVSVPQPMLSTTASTGATDAILMRLLSKEYEVTQPATNLRCSPAVKISFRIASRASIGSIGTETRIPLPSDQFREVCALLETRSELFGASIFKEQKLGYLYL